MKVRLLFLTLLLGLSMNLNAKIIDDSVSYSMGVQVAISLKKNGILDKFEKNASFIEALEDMQTGNLKLTMSDMERVLNDYFNKIYEREKAENGAKGQAFLEKNAKEQGVVVLPSGLQYKILKAGTGTVKPKPTDNVEVHYKGSLVDGGVFESSYNSGEPVKFLLSGVIPGWTEGLQYITEGGKIQLFIPANLAYGNRVMSGSPIAPNSTLIFEVELLKILAGETTPDKE